MWGATRLAAAPADRSEIEAPRGVVHAARPTAEIIENSNESISLLFRCEPDARTNQLSVLVRVPDTGAIEAEVGLVDRVTFMPGDPGAESDANARSLEPTIRASEQPGTNEKHHHLPYVSPAFRRIYRSTVLNYDDSTPRASRQSWPRLRRRDRRPRTSGPT